MFSNFLAGVDCQICQVTGHLASFFRILFTELRYDGHLPLRHSTIWVGMHVFENSWRTVIFYLAFQGLRESLK
jgi:hypothetical protein